MRYEGKTVFATAGASGIGRATVRRLASEGATVVFCDIAEDKGQQVEDEVRKAGGRVHFTACNVMDEAAVAALIEDTVARFGRLDVAMNIVGGNARGDVIGAPLHEGELANWNGTVELCLSSVFIGMKHQIRAMLKTGGGAIANVSSMVGLRYTPHTSWAYAAAKAAVVHLTAVSAVSYAKQGIRVNAIAPGLTGTEAVERSMSVETRDALVGQFHPNGRLVSPDSQAATLVWLCSDDARDITGLTIPVDGGWSAN